MKGTIKSLAICAFVASIFASASSCGGGSAHHLTTQQWTLESIRHSDSSAAIRIPDGVTISFSDSSMVYGSAGCNTFFARYQTDRGGKITINPPGATMMWCLDMSFENAYLKMIELAESYRATAERLTISGPAFTLTYRAHATDSEPFIESDIEAAPETEVIEEAPVEPINK